MIALPSQTAAADKGRLFPKATLTVLFAMCLAGCQSTSGPKFETAPDTPANRAQEVRLVAEAIRSYNWFGEYLSRPPELVIEFAKIGKPLGFIPIEFRGSAGMYCVHVIVQDPARGTFFSKAGRFFLATVLQATDNPTQKRVTLLTSTRQQPCYLHGTGDDMPELVGLRLKPPS